MPTNERGPVTRLTFTARMLVSMRALTIVLRQERASGQSCPVTVAHKQEALLSLVADGKVARRGNQVDMVSIFGPEEI